MIPKHVPTKENFADIFTKILDKATFEHLRDQIMLPYNPDKIWEGENEFTAPRAHSTWNGFIPYSGLIWIFGINWTAQAKDKKWSISDMYLDVLRSDTKKTLKLETDKNPDC